MGSVLLETVGNLGQASAEDIANAADLDIGRVETSLRRLARAGGKQPSKNMVLPPPAMARARNHQNP